MSDNTNSADASGNTVNNYGPTTGQLLTIGSIGAFALGISIFNLFHSLQDRQEYERQFTSAERSWQNRFEMQMQQCSRTEVAAKLVERRLIDMESYALLNGWKVPKDDQHGPLGNLERLKGDSDVRR